MNEKPHAIGVAKSFLWFGVPATALYGATFHVLPRLVAVIGMHPLAAWFLSGGVVFAGLFITAVWMARHESERGDPWNRLRLRPMTADDWKAALGAIVVCGAFMAVFMSVLEGLSNAGIIGLYTGSPAFLEFERLGPGERHLFLLWPPLFFFNIAGEELLWRGYILPHQEVRFGRHAWLVNGLFWGMFHAAFGWKMIVLLAPVLLILPFVVQKRGNTLVGIVIHGFINASGFIATTVFGL